MKRYNPKEIEPTWQKVWAKSKIYEASEDTSKSKRYVLEYFPYPSGAAMHVGHVRNYTIGDAIARFARMQGHNVLHPMGWDAFGLPAENYAIKTGISPQQAVAENVGRFKEQLMQMGFSYDWSREVNSTDPAYYKWTQWYFLLLFKKGLAYQQESLQWWCPFDKTVLANEQVENGRCWRCGHEVEKKSLKQWFFKITDYADRLDQDLEKLDWSDAIKSMQHNWIGRSVGAEINFKVDDLKEPVKVFTTRADTVFGATFLVLAPEHPLVAKLTTAEHRAKVNSYIKESVAKSDIERQETNREKTGEFTGSYALNPATKEQIPVWVADYVLPGYGTGAIMAVPAHDERDNEFALKFGLPIVNVIEPTFGESHPDEKHKVGVNVVLRNPKTNEIIILDWGPRKKDHGGQMLIGGGVEAGEDIVECAAREITEETGYKNVKFIAKSEAVGHGHFYSNVKDQYFSIDAHGLLFDLVDDEKVELNLDEGEKNKFSVNWVPADQAVPMLDDGIHKYFGETLALGKCYEGEGILVNSGKYNGMSTSTVREKIITDITGMAEKVNYKMRDWLISRQRYWGAPIPIIHCPKCGPQAVPEKDLPVVLPVVKSYEPTGDGQSPLASVEEFVNVACPKCGGEAKRETDTMDGFACSSWYFLRFADPKNDEEPFARDKADFWLPVDDYIGGAEHAVMHLLYARFWTKVMFDEGLINFDEPFSSLRNQGMILAPDGAKMSKSKGNTIEPETLLSQGYGADSVRIMELFIGPWNQSANWSVEGMGGAYRFLQRVWTLSLEFLESTPDAKNNIDEASLTATVARTTKKVSHDLENLSFNTALAALMGLVNELYKLKASGGLAQTKAWRGAIETLIQLLAPFAPHITEELWQELGHSESVHISSWPGWDEQLIKEDLLTLAVQINGKVRGEITITIDATEEEVLAEAKKAVQDKLAGQKIKKAIYVPGRIVSLVV